MKTAFATSEIRALGALAAVVMLGVGSSTQRAFSAERIAPRVTAIDSTAHVSPWSRDTLDGLSGKLWMKLMSSTRGDTTSVLSRLFGDSAVRFPGVYVASDTEQSSGFAFVNLVPFTEKKNGMLGTYRMGSWPAEQRNVSDRYDNPQGFIRVTPETQDTRISEHFRLRDFLTHDQQSVWPKYLVLREGLIDKLELVIGALNKRGITVSHMSVMSGFRTPQYNEKGVGVGGRAQNSRHQYGDAADVYVDNDGNGGMDDLNGDGRVNTNDARWLAQVVEQVEQDYPALTGGIGIYSATGAHGPFVHVDVRGVKARW